MEPLAETEQQPIKGVPASKAARLTADKMEWYADTGTSMDPIFDKRVALTFKAFDVALEYVLNGRLVGPAAAQNNVESQEFDGVKNSWGDSTAR